MDNWLKNPWAIRFVSLVLAVLLYTAVSLSQSSGSEDRTFTSSGTDQSERISGVPVEILMDEENYVVSGVPETVVVGLEGPTSALLPIIRQSTFDVYVDLRDYEPGTHEVDIQIDNVPDNVNAYIEPRTIEVTIEERASAEFDVEVDYLNVSQMVNGYEVQGATVNPETVTIISSQSEVDKVAAVKAYVDMRGVEASIDSREVPVNVYDSLGNELNVLVEPETVSVSVEVGNPSKEVPIEANTAGELPDGLVLDSVTMEPGEATVYGSTETLEAITELLTEEIDLSQITESTEMEVSLIPPSGTSRIEPEQVQVMVELSQAEASTFENVEITTENLPDNQSVTFVEPDSDSMDVTVLGPEDELNEVTAEDIQLTIDFTGADRGEHQAEVTADVPGDLVTDPEYDEVTVLIE